MNDDPSFASFYPIVIFALYAHEQCIVYGIRAVARVTASVLTVLWCAMLWENSYACMLGMKIVNVIVVCF